MSRISFVFVFGLLYYVHGISLYDGNTTNGIYTCGHTGSTFTTQVFNIREQLKLISPSYNTDGCHDVSSDNNLKLKYKNSIILILRGGCTFADKIYYAQKLGAKGVIVGNRDANDPNCKLTMSISSSDHRNITIPSVFISYNDYNVLKQYISTHDIIQVSMTNDDYDTHLTCGTTTHMSRTSHSRQIKTFGVFIFISIPSTWFLIICCGILKRRCSRYRKKKKRQSALKKIPIIKYQSKIKKTFPPNYKQLLDTNEAITNDNNRTDNIKSDTTNDTTKSSKKEKFKQLLRKIGKKNHVNKFIHNDTCCVCLDEFVNNEKIKALKCGHGFHIDCIDPWLNDMSDKCPVCKHSIFDDNFDAQKKVIIEMHTTQ